MSKWLTEQLKFKWMRSITVMLFVCFSIDAITSAFVSVMIDTSWSELSGTQRWIRCALILKAWAMATVAFLTSAAKKIERDESPFTGDTTVTTKTSTEVKTS